MSNFLKFMAKFYLSVFIFSTNLKFGTWRDLQVVPVGPVPGDDWLWMAGDGKLEVNEWLRRLGLGQP
jgi:hypothetical protein